MGVSDKPFVRVSVKTSNLTPSAETDTNLALSLLVFGVFADHADHPFAFHDLTLITDLFDRSPYLHALYPIIAEIELKVSDLRPHPGAERKRGSPEMIYFSRIIIRPRERS